LLKGFDQRGFVFYTNYASEKGQQLEKCPYAALCLFWVELHRQIRISGMAEKTSREESEKYFHSRPIGAQLGAWTSRQSDVIDARQVLDARLSEYSERYAGKEIPLPAHWGGYKHRIHIDRRSPRRAPLQRSRFLSLEDARFRRD
jgi:pyridoxamine 5'-phosphate oxidase